MVGAIIFVVVMILVVPVGVMLAGGAWSAVFGWAHPSSADEAGDETAEEIADETTEEPASA